MTDYRITRVKTDVNGNGRLVVSWLAIPGAKNYADAVQKAHKIGGRKYNTKEFAGGIVFQADESELRYAIESIDDDMGDHNPCEGCKHSYAVTADPRGTSSSGYGCQLTGARVIAKCTKYAST